MKQPSSSSAVNRRQFLSASLGAAAGLAVPTIIPGSALGLNGSVAPSERIVMGCIGIGRRGTHDLRWMLPEKDVQFVAICDARRERRQAVKQMIDDHYGTGDCTMYDDVREFLAARPDIDGILTATGDRWHALMSILAMRAGKDVYTEKPSCMTIAEGQAVVETAKRYGRVYQTGTQRLSEANHVFCIEAAKGGLLGEVHTAYAHIAPWDSAYPEHAWHPGEPEPPKDVVDWDAWLGPCPWRPYHSSYVSGGWRGHYDFHTTCIGEWGAHTFAQAQAGLDTLDTNPVAYEYVENEAGDRMITHFANDKRMILSKGNAHWHGSCGERFDGDSGWVAAADGYSQPETNNPALLGEFKKVVDEYMARTQRPMNHVRNFFDCVKSRLQTVANPEVMYRSMATVHAANICMWLKRDLRYDPVNGVFIDDDEANRYRSRAMRAPWII